MPCICDYPEPTRRQAESLLVRQYLREVGYKLPPHRDTMYGDERQLDKDTELLCEWCSSHDVKSRSLELQIWWRDHQESDRQRAQREARAAKLRSDKERALAKLSPTERKLLGL